MRRRMLLKINRFSTRSPPRPWLQLYCLTMVKPYPYLSLNASAVGGCQDCCRMLLLFLELSGSILANW